MLSATVMCPSYGFRNIPRELLKEIDANPRVILKVVREIPPISVDKIRGLVAIGPYIQKPVLKPISKKQEELSIKMDRVLEKLLKRNYSFYIYKTIFLLAYILFLLYLCRKIYGC